MKSAAAAAAPSVEILEDRRQEMVRGSLLYQLVNRVAITDSGPALLNQKLLRYSICTLANRANTVV